MPAGRVEKNNKAMETLKRMWVAPGEVARSPDGSPLLTKVLYKHMQGLLSSETAVIAETGALRFGARCA